MMNLAQALDQNARTRPDHPAIIASDRSVTHAELTPLVRREAAHLLSLGLKHQALVGVCLKDSFDHVILLYALARAGLVMLPMDVRWTTEERERVARHFGAELVLVEPGAAALSMRTVAVDEAWRRAAAQQDPDRDFPVSGEDRLLLSLSSGTTGRPKGPVVTHHQFFRRFMTHWINMGLNSHDRYVSATPLYFGGGRTFVMSVLFSGGTVILHPLPYELEDLVAAVGRHEATSLFLVPTLLRRLLELDPATLAPMQRLRLLFSSGAPLHPDERRAIRERVCANFYEYYASTEGGGVSLLTPEDQRTYGDSVGRAIFGVEIEIVDEQHRPLPPGTTGTLRYRGPGVATGYYRDPEASQEAFHDGWFYPGDLAECDRRGFIFLRGRRKDMIIRGGVNVYPAEIEAILMAHPAVADAAVVGWPSREFGEEVAAFVKLRRTVDVADLMAWCSGRLASYKRPKEIFPVSDLPRNSGGKVLKAELVARLAPV